MPYVCTSEDLDQLDLIPDRIVASLVSVFRNGGGLVTGESYYPCCVL